MCAITCGKKCCLKCLKELLKTVLFREYYSIDCWVAEHYFLMNRGFYNCGPIEYSDNKTAVFSTSHSIFYLY